MTAFLNMPTLGQPEAYVANANTVVDDKGEIVAASKDFFSGFFTAFEDLIKKHK